MLESHAKVSSQHHGPSAQGVEGFLHHPSGLLIRGGPAGPCHGCMGWGCPCHLALGALCPAGALSCPLHDSQALRPSPPLCNPGQAFKASALQQRAPRAVLVCPAVTGGCTGMKWEGNTPGVTAQLAGPTRTVRLSLHPTTGPIHMGFAMCPCPEPPQKGDRLEGG